MNRLAIVILASLISCSTTQLKENNTRNSLCQNETDLISKFDSIAHTDYILLDLKDDIQEKIPQILNNIEPYQNVFFNVIHHSQFDTIVPLAVTYHYSGRSHTKLVDIPRYIILLNTRGNVLFGPEIISIDSVENRVCEFLMNVGKDEYPISYDRVGFTLAWDNGVNARLFDRLVDQFIFGYLKYIDYESGLLFEKDVCQLDSVELATVARKFPFSLHIAEHKTIE